MNMALIECPECKKEISDTVKKCPNCGYKFKKKTSLVVKIALVLVVVALVGGVMFCGLKYYLANQYIKQKKYTDAIIELEAIGFLPMAADKLEEVEKIVGVDEETTKLELIKDRFRKATSGTKGNTRLGSDELSITIDSESDSDENSIEDIASVIVALDLPDSLWDQMAGTSALMGRQEEVYDDIKVSWTYHPDNGLDVQFRYVGDL